MLKLKSWWHLPGIASLPTSYFRRVTVRTPTPSEIAITQSAYPDSIKNAVCTPTIAPTGPIRDALDYRADSPMAE